MNRYPTQLSVMLILSLCASVLGEDTQRTAEQKSFRQFREEIFPLMMREAGGCIECHESETTSQLVLTGDAKSDFRRLLDAQYLSGSGGDSLLGRLTSKNKELRMPKDAKPWTKAEVATLRKIVRLAKEIKVDVATDEEFPRSLLAKYHGEVNARPDSQFITYRQLRGKIAVIFADDWVRGDRDLFAENVSLFGGADFETRFNESHTPRASFLVGMEMLSRDIASRAYQLRRGPFKNWPESFPSSFKRKSERGQFTQTVRQLYQRVLYRSASDAEVEEALSLIGNVHQLRNVIAARDAKLSFELTATDSVTGMQSRKTIEFPVSGERLNVAQSLIDQSVAPLEKNREVVEATLGEFDLSPNVPGQRFVLHNIGTFRNVSFAGLVLRNVESDQTSKVNADDPKVNVEGAWELDEDRGVFSFEDENRHKALSNITVPLDVETAGTYELSL